MNLALGGRSRTLRPDREQLKFCRDVMERARFPYAHIDIVVLEDGRCYLSEIALDGGIKGASVERQELEKRKKKLLDEMARTIIGRD